MHARILSSRDRQLKEIDNQKIYDVLCNLQSNFVSSQDGWDKEDRDQSDEVWDISPFIASTRDDI